MAGSHLARLTEADSRRCSRTWRPGKAGYDLEGLMDSQRQKLLITALAYLDAGLSVLPAHLEKKYAALLVWKTYQGRLPTRAEIEAWFSNRHDALCLVGGAVS